MELIWKDLEAVRLIAEAETTLPADGLLPPPDGRTVREVLYCTAEAAVNSIQLDSDRAELEGTLEVRITALDDEGAVFAFESAAGFTHSLNAAGAQQGMRADAEACVTSLQARAAEGGASFAAELKLGVTVYSHAPIRVIAGVSGIGDMELRTRQTSVTVREELGARTLNMREELAEAGVAEVISCSGQVTVRDVSAERDGVTVSGVLTVHALTADGDGRVSGLVRQVPFRERLDISAPMGEVFCTADVRSVGVHALGEEFALLAMEAEIAFTLFAVVKRELVLTADAFSPSMGFDCLYENASLLSRGGRCSMQTQFKETIDLPLGLAELSEPLFASARPIITSIDTENGETIISGVFATSLVYESAGANIYSYTEDIPFSLPLPAECTCNMPKAVCACAVQITGSTERTAQLAYTLQTDVELFDIEEASFVAGLAEKEPPSRVSGLIIAFASEADEFYDIAKRYSVSCESVKKLNPNAKEPLHEGERLLLLV